jgi:Fur family peroxide stress response transcriptional regulator
LADPRERLEQMLQVLRDKGGRLTPQRLAILKIMAQSGEHPGIEQIYDRIKIDFPTTSLATIYKTISLLKDMGEVLELTLASAGTRYDGNRPYPHPHIICTKCGRILDPEIGGVAAVSEAMARQTGYKITHHQLNFFGLCPKCQQEG